VTLDSPAMSSSAEPNHSDGEKRAHQIAGRRSSWWRRAISATLVYIAAFSLALAGLALVISALGGDPGSAVATMLQASLGSPAAIAQTLSRSTPLMIGAVAVALALRAGYFNIGVDGQIYAGAIVATGVGLIIGNVPVAVGVLVMLVAGAVGGALLGSIPAWLRARWGVSEIFVTVMLNFIAYYLAEYLATGPWNDPVSGEAITRRVATSVRLPHFLPGGGHTGIFIAIAIAFAISTFLLHSWRGFEFRSAGYNVNASRWAGVDLVKVGVRVLILSAALGGIAGAIEVSGVHGRLIIGMAPNYGLLAFLVAVVALKSPAAVVPVALVFGVLLVGTDSLQRSVGLPFAAVLTFQGVVVTAVLVLNTLVDRYRELPPSLTRRTRLLKMLAMRVVASV
jgi:general nucleoside transport system permease protein